MRSKLFIALTLAKLIAPSFTHAGENALALQKAGPEKVLVESRFAYSADENRPAAERLLEAARRSPGEGSEALEKAVRRWPDVALELFRDSIASESDVPLRLKLADAYDHVFPLSDPKAGWAEALKASTSQRKNYAKFVKARGEILALFQSGRFAESGRLDVGAALPGDAPVAFKTEALRLNALSALLDEKLDRASELFSKALLSAQKGSKHIQFDLGLLASETERRRGHTAQAIRTWRSAIASAADVKDPELWERAILGKTVEASWPAEAAIAGASEPNFAASGGTETADVLIGIGKMRLARGAAQPALLAFSRAESETAIDGKKSLARLYRVQTMISLQQAASALPMLEALVKTADIRIARRAKAIQGDVLCRVLKDRTHGIPILQEALETPAAEAAAGSDDWPGKNRLQANLGLYMLLEGREVEGLRRLHESEAQFEALGQTGDLLDALKNESAILHANHKTTEAKALESRIEKILAEGPASAQNNKIPEP